MTTRTVLLIPGVFNNLDAGDNLPLIADRRDDGGLTLTTLDEATRIELHADDVAQLARFALPPAPQIRDDAPAPTAEPGAVHITPIARKPAAPRPIFPEGEAAFRAAIYAALRDMAQDGKMPSQKQWDAHRPAHLPTQTTVRTRLSCKWVELAKLVGLTVNEERVRSARRAIASRWATPATPPNGRAAAEEGAAKREAVREQAVAVLRDMGNGAGRMPSMKEYNARKPAEMPRAGELMAALGLNYWGEMAKLAGLIWTPGLRVDK